MEKTNKIKLKKYHWIIVLITITTVIIMYVFAETDLYITEPFDIGFDIFIDIGSGVMFVSLITIGIIIGFVLFRKKKNYNK